MKIQLAPINWYYITFSTLLNLNIYIIKYTNHLHMIKTNFILIYFKLVKTAYFSL